MRYDCTRILKDWRGKDVKMDASMGPENAGQPWKMGTWLAQHLAMSAVIPKEKTLRAAALCIRLETAATHAPGEPEAEKAKAFVALSAEDVTLIRQMIESTPGMPPYIQGQVRYLIDPDSLSQEERETFEGLYGPLTTN